MMQSGQQDTRRSVAAEGISDSNNSSDNKNNNASRNIHNKQNRNTIAIIITRTIVTFRSPIIRHHVIFLL